MNNPAENWGVKRNISHRQDLATFLPGVLPAGPKAMLNCRVQNTTCFAHNCLFQLLDKPIPSFLDGCREKGMFQNEKTPPKMVYPFAGNPGTSSSRMFRDLLCQAQLLTKLAPRLTGRDIPFFLRLSVAVGWSMFNLGPPFLTMGHFSHVGMIIVVVVSTKWSSHVKDLLINPHVDGDPFSKFF